MGVFPVEILRAKKQLPAISREPLHFSSPNRSQRFTNIPVDADAPFLYFSGTERLSIIDTGIDGFVVRQSHLPEWVLYDDRRVVPDTQFQKQYSSAMSA